MKVYLLILFASLGLAYFSLKPSQPSSNAINQLVEKEMNELQIPGMAVAVIKDGKILHQETYGMANLEWNQKVTPTTAFQIASVTKLFTSTLVMKYIQDGKIRLDDSVVKYLPDAPASWSQVQIKHLLSHQSGIPWPASIGGFLGTAPSTSDKPASKEQVYKDMRDSTLLYNPGEKEVYINGDAFVLQFVLEKIGGKSIAEIFEEELFSPLGMKGSGFDQEVRNFPAQVMRPIKNKSQLFTKGTTEPLILKSYYNPTSYAGGGLYTTLEDAVKWAVSLDKGDFIDREIVEQLSSKMPLNGSFTSLGWNRLEFNGHEAFGHTGGPGLGDVLYFPEEKLTIIVFSNYADMYPYMAASIACLFFPDIVLPSGPKTFDRGFYKYF
ncbi:class A beta-lactamase-related serine hydrolase [Algoriphagus lacus]|uniref:Class A beta-lactamase-related serine hydrolase n=1 Tax=Algoriphagus lacus TaxID=2056311 RepID=A0A418PSF2_9BACT|nr:serine hydrolase domain-containing protein [Algoriphagus lacus]RIW15772.1 class A beta-lactamase-related serine hydrolase [Algoriphagus lacus]